MSIFTNAREVILRVREASIEARRKSALITAFDLIALVKLRVQTQGKDSNNVSFVPYTLPYAKEVKRQGGNPNKVTFTRTGRMWAAIKPEIIEDTIERTVVEIKARTQDAQNKLNGQFRKRGNILLLTDEEIEIALEGHLERILNETNV